MLTIDFIEKFTPIYQENYFLDQDFDSIRYILNKPIK